MTGCKQPNLEPTAFRVKKALRAAAKTRKCELRWSSELNVGFQGGGTHQLLAIATILVISSELRLSLAILSDCPCPVVAKKVINVDNTPYTSAPQ